MMDDLINTIENVVIWLFLIGVIFWAWLHWIIRRQKKLAQEERDLAEFYAQDPPIAGGQPQDQEIKSG